MIYIVRHGQTDWNTLGLIQGVADIPLNVKGIVQAMEAAPTFKDHHFTKVYTSPLKRAKTTAEILTKNSKVDDFVVDDRLIEYDFGSREGKPLHTTHDNEAEVEDEDEFIKRVTSILVDAATTPGNVMLVSHGAVIGTIVRSLLPEELQDKFHLPNCSTVLVGNEMNDQGQIGLSLLGITTDEETLQKALTAGD